MKNTMTNCSESLERLPLYVGGELDVLDAALVAGHLNQCEPCSHEEQVLQRSRVAFREAVAAPQGELGELNLWEGIRASMLSEGLLNESPLVQRELQPEPKPYTLRPVASAAPKLSLVRQLVGVAAAAAIIGVASLAGSGLLGLDGSDPGSTYSTGHGASVAKTLQLLDGESEMRSLAPGEISLSPYARSLQPAYQASPQSSAMDAGGGSLAGFQTEPDSGVPTGFEIR